MGVLLGEKPEGGVYDKDDSEGSWLTSLRLSGSGGSDGGSDGDSSGGTSGGGGNRRSGLKPDELKDAEENPDEPAENDDETSGENALDAAGDALKDKLTDASSALGKEAGMLEEAVRGASGAKKFLSSRAKIAIASGATVLIILLIMMMFLLSTLKVVHFGEVLATAGYARFNGIMQERTTQNIFDASVVEGEGSIDTFGKSMLDRLKLRNVDLQIAKLGQEGVIKFEVDGNKLTGVRLPESGERITLDGLSKNLNSEVGSTWSELNSTKARTLHPIESARARAAVRYEFTQKTQASIGSALELEPRFVRSRTFSYIADNVGFKFGRWRQKGREFISKNVRDAAIEDAVNEQQETLKVGDDTISDNVSEPVKENIKKARAAEKIKGFLEKNDGIFNEEKFAASFETDIANATKVQEVATKVGTIVLLLSLACMTNDAARNVENIAIQNEKQATKIAYDMLAARDQTKAGDVSTIAEGGTARRYDGMDQSASYQYDSGQKVTSKTRQPNIKPAISPELLTIIKRLSSPSTLAIPGLGLLAPGTADAIDTEFCSQLLSPTGAVVGATAEVVVQAVVAFFTAGGGTVATEGGARATAELVVRSLGEAIFNSAKGLVSFRSIGTLGAVGLYGLGLQYVVTMLSGTTFSGAESGARGYDGGHAGTSLAQARQTRIIGGVKQNNLTARELDKSYMQIAMKKQMSGGVFARYFSIKNPYSLIGRMSAVSPGVSTSTVSGFTQTSLMNFGSAGKTIFGNMFSAIPVFQHAFADSANGDYNPYGDVVQRGYSKDELNKMRNDESYNFYNNAAILGEAKIAEIDSQIGKCFDPSRTETEVERDTDCSVEKLTTDEAFRYRIYKFLDKPMVDGTNEDPTQPSNIGAKDDPASNITEAPTTPTPAPSGSTGTITKDKTSEIPGAGGVRIATENLAAFNAMVAAAQKDGINLLPISSGWRDPEQQIALRKQNCPDWQNSPSSSCSPPTAKPGTSNHEKGNAIDFGSMCFAKKSVPTCPGNKRWDWLRKNAQNFKFYQLPSEAWHWSTTGG